MTFETAHKKGFLCAISLGKKFKLKKIIITARNLYCSIEKSYTLRFGFLNVPVAIL